MFAVMVTALHEIYQVMTPVMEAFVHQSKVLKIITAAIALPYEVVNILCAFLGVVAVHLVKKILV